MIINKHFIHVAGKPPLAPSMNAQSAADMPGKAGTTPRGPAEGSSMVSLRAKVFKVDINLALAVKPLIA